MRRLLLAILLSLTPTLWAAEPRVVVSHPKVVPVGSQVVLDAQGSIHDTEFSLGWEVIEPASLQLETADKGGRTDVIGYFTAEKAGTYQIAVTAYGSSESKPRLAHTKTFEILVKNISPDPKPGPKPDPKPAPVPANEELWLTLVFEQNRMTLSETLFMIGTEWRRVARDNNINVFVLYSNSNEVGKKQLEKYLPSELPAAVVQRANGVVLEESTKTVKDEASLISLLKSLRGK